MNHIVKFLPEGGTGFPTPDFSRAVINSISQKVLTQRRNITYFNRVVAKNDCQNWSSEIFKKVHSHLLRGFFYARNLVHCAIMTGCVGEPLASALGSPLSFLSGKTNPAQFCHLSIGLESDSLKFKKETAHV